MTDPAQTQATGPVAVPTPSCIRPRRGAGDRPAAELAVGELAVGELAVGELAVGELAGTSVRQPPGALGQAQRRVRRLPPGPGPAGRTRGSRTRGSQARGGRA